MTALSLEALAERLASDDVKPMLDDFLATLARDFSTLTSVELRQPPSDRGRRFGWEVARHLAANGTWRVPHVQLVAFLITAFAKITPLHGTLDAARVFEKFGRTGQTFFLAIAALSQSSVRPRLADRVILEALDPSVQRRLLLSKPRERSMPVLAEFCAKHAEPNEFAGFKLFGVQHLFLSSLELFDTFATLGIAASDMAFQGKIYSTNFRVLTELTRNGCEVDAVSTQVFSSFDEAMASGQAWRLAKITSALPPPSANATPRVLLIDDGGDAIVTLHRDFAAWAPYFVCVEQTRRGARLLRGLDLRCPVANVAESWAKLTAESPMIGHSVVREVQAKLAAFDRAEVERSRQALVIGFGAVGRAVAQSLAADDYTVAVFDPNPAVREQARVAGFSSFDRIEEALPHGHLVVSCVGATTIGLAQAAHLPDGAILVNAASGDSELGADLLARIDMSDVQVDDSGWLSTNFRGRTVKLGLSSAKAHCDAIAIVADKQLYIVNHGFVVNMTGDRDPIPPRYIQLTRTLLLLGALTARRAPAVGLIDIPMPWQEALVAAVQAQLQTTGEDLFHPTF